MIVPYAAGGPTDTVGRVVAERMRAELGQTDRCWRTSAAPAAASVSAASPAPRPTATPSTSATGAPMSSTARSIRCPMTSRPISSRSRCSRRRRRWWSRARRCRPTTCKGLIAWLKANRDKTTVGTAGVGSPPHIGGVLLQSMTGTHVAVRALSRHVAGDAGSGRGPDRHGGQRSDHGDAAGARRHHQGLCDRGADAPAGAAGCADLGRGRPAGLSCLDLECAVRAEGHAEGRSSRSSTPRRSWRSPIRRCARASPRSARRFRRASSRRRRRSARSTRPTSRSGGRSSRPRNRYASDCTVPALATVTDLWLLFRHRDHVRHGFQG